MNKILVLAIVIPLVSACAGPYRIDKATKLAEKLEKISSSLESQRKEAIRAYRFDVIETLVSSKVVLTPDSFASIVCGHATYVVGAASLTFASQAQTLGETVEAPKSGSFASLLKKLKATASRIEGSDGPESTPQNECEKEVKADVTSRTSIASAPSIASVVSLVDFFATLLSKIEAERRGVQIAQMIRENESSLWSAYYVLACPRGTQLSNFPKGRPEVKLQNSLGCGDLIGQSEYSSFLLDLRRRQALGTFSSVSREILSSTSLPAIGSLEELARYDTYREAHILERNNEGLVFGLRNAMTKLIDAVILGPSASGEELDAVIGALRNLDDVMKAWKDYEKS